MKHPLGISERRHPLRGFSSPGRTGAEGEEMIRVLR
jgi:hypothetical protein